jgi:hypothetical protein
MKPNYDSAAFMQALLFLADRGLIELSAGRGPFELIANADWPVRLQSAFANDGADPDLLTNTAIDLSPEGERVLQLFKIGHP